MVMELLVALENGNRNNQPRRPIREVGRIFYKDDSFLLKRYRMPRQMLEELTGTVYDHLLSNDRGLNLAPDVQVACALRVLTEGNFQRPAGDTIGVSQASVSRILHRFCDALLTAYPYAIHFPNTEQEIAETKRCFQERFGLSL